MTETDFDVMVGRNVKALRNAADLTQTELAERLTAAGYPMQQQTVLKIERGSRPLKLEEALVVADILDVPTESLWEERLDRANIVAGAVSAATSLQTAWEELEEAVVKFERARWNTKHWLQGPRAELLPEHLLAKVRALESADTAKIIEAGRRRFEAELQYREAAGEAAVPVEQGD